jgi:hypothetical protein
MVYCLWWPRLLSLQVTVVTASILIIVISSVLLVYWFRYTCMLILGRNYCADYALKVASTIRLNFPQAETTLQTERRAYALDHIYESLENDYRILTDLLGDAAGQNSIERRFLTMDFKMMRIWYGLTKTSRNLPRSRNALSEMSSILGYFAAEIAQSGAF